jgi:hypothetical protein
MLNPSDGPQVTTAHAIRVRDLRIRFGDADAFAAECSCGWRHAGSPAAQRGEMSPST